MLRRVCSVKVKQTLEERFWSKVDIREDDECWPWTAALGTRGYGSFSYPHGKAKMIQASRFVLLLREGFDLPSDVVARHTCNNTSCCNPKHIVSGSQLENVQDFIDTGGYKVKGFKTAKLTADDVANIQAMRADGIRLFIIADTFGVSASQISRVSRGISTKRFEG